MKKKLAIAGMISPIIISLIWIVETIIFSFVDQATTGQMITHSYVNMIVGILMIISIIWLVVGVFIIGRDKDMYHREILTQARTDTKKHMPKFLLGLLLMGILQLFQNMLTDEGQQITLLTIGLMIIIGILYIWVDLGVRQFALDIVHQKTPKISELFVDIKKLGKYILAYILTQIAVIIGLVLFILPGIIISLRLVLVPYLILEKNLGPIQAIKTSWHMTKGYSANIFALNFVLGFINILGFFALLIGLLWTIPLFYITNAYMYKKLLALHHNK